VADRHSRRSALKVGGTAAAGLVLAACTGGSPATETTAASTTQATTPPPTSAETGATTTAGTGSGSASASPPVTAPVDNLAPDGYSATAIPESQVTDAIAMVQEIATDVMERTNIPGMAIAVVHRGELVFARGYGVREVGKPETVDETTVFQIASVSKSVGSTVVAKAVTDSVVAWSDPIQQYLPTFALADPEISKIVTIADMYSHRSGIPAAAGDDIESLGFTREQIIEKLRLFPLDPFRISYGYTNFGMTTGAQAVATAAGVPWEELSAQTLYEPLGMSSTSSSYDEFLTRDNRTTLHFNDDGTFEPLYLRDADAQSPAGGVSSNVVDMAAWMMMNLAAGEVDGRPFIDPDVLLEAHKPHAASRPAQTPLDRTGFYGYGFNVDTTSTGHQKWSHSGAFYVGAATAYAMIPAADVGIIVLTNASPIGAAEAVTTSFSDLVRTAAIERDWLEYFGNIFQGLFVNESEVATTPTPASPAPPRPTADYLGTYTSAYAGDAVVTANGDTLTVAVGPAGKSAPLTHYSGDVFAWLPPGDAGEPLSAVRFDGNPGGPAQTVTLDFLDSRQLGTFTRIG
jgi:CubicO group peptidase (beta-lactamase class C family)